MKLQVQEPYFNERREIRFKVGEVVDCADEMGAFFLRDQPSAFKVVEVAGGPPQGIPAPVPAPEAHTADDAPTEGPPAEEPTADAPPPAEPRRKSGRSRTRG